MSCRRHMGTSCNNSPWPSPISLKQCSLLSNSNPMFCYHYPLSVWSEFFKVYRSNANKNKWDFYAIFEKSRLRNTKIEWYAETRIQARYRTMSCNYWKWLVNLEGSLARSQSKENLNVIEKQQFQKRLGFLRSEGKEISTGPSLSLAESGSCAELCSLLSVSS